MIAHSPDSRDLVEDVHLVKNPYVGAVAVIIVAFRNSQDLDRCLQSLRLLNPEPPFAVFICENGGFDAFDRLVETLIARQGPCDPDDATPTLASARLSRVRRLRLRTLDHAGSVMVHVGEARENLGYAGGVNAFLEPLLDQSAYAGFWILNPDTQPFPDALTALVEYADRHHRGMVGSRLVQRHKFDVVQGRGLIWRRWRASTLLVDWLSPAAPLVPHLEVQLDSPSGASLYVTRDLVTRIGLMDERYFLYFEDLDWGFRAKRHGPVGYADRSVVVHEGGTTIGSAISRGQGSELATFLDFRNRILFVQRYFPGWLAWTVLVGLLEIVDYWRLCAFRSSFAALRGMLAGLLGRTGRPGEGDRAPRRGIRAQGGALGSRSPTPSTSARGRCEATD